MNWKRFGICRERRQNAQKLPGQSSGYLGRSLSLRSLWIWREFATFVRTWCRPVFIVKLWGWEVMAVCCIGEARCAGGIRFFCCFVVFCSLTFLFKVSASKRECRQILFFEETEAHFVQVSYVSNPRIYWASNTNWIRIGKQSVWDEQCAVSKRMSCEVGVFYKYIFSAFTIMYGTFK